MKTLTERQASVLRWIAAFIQKNGMPPTVREIGRHFGISSAGVFGHLKALETKGFVRRGELGARSLEIVRGAPRQRPDRSRVPIVGQIAAGLPLLAEENVEGHVTLGDSVLPDGDGRLFALRVRGDSMIGAGILDGDLAVCRQQDNARDGDIVVALVDDEATLKRFYREPARVRLEPANPAVQPIYARSVRVQGVMKALVREKV